MSNLRSQFQQTERHRDVNSARNLNRIGKISRKSIEYWCQNLSWRIKLGTARHPLTAKSFVKNIRRRKCSPLNADPTWLAFDSTWPAYVVSKSTGRECPVLHEDLRLWLHMQVVLLYTNSLASLPTPKLRDAFLTRLLLWRLFTTHQFINLKHLLDFSKMFSFKVVRSRKLELRQK